MLSFLKINLSISTKLPSNDISSFTPKPKTQYFVVLLKNELSYNQNRSGLHPEHPSLPLCHGQLHLPHEVPGEPIFYIIATYDQSSSSFYNCYCYFMINRHRFQGFDFAEEQNMAFKMSSFAETMALGYLKSQVHKYKSAQIHKYKARVLAISSLG